MRVLAPFGRRPVQVTGVDDLGAYRVLRVDDPGGPQPWPGQFYMLAAVQRWGAGEDERPYLPRAFSFASAQDGRLSFMFEDVGPGTRRLAELVQGDEVWIAGPLGVGFGDPADGRRAILAGGGIGIPPLAAWAATLAQRGIGATAVLGFRDAHHAEGARLLGRSDAMADGTVAIATDDGSAGHHGLVTDLLAQELDRDDHATVYSCGPPRMLEAVRALACARSVPAQLALEAGMACGFGACFGCAVPVAEGGYVRVCVEGPVLDAQRLLSVLSHP